MHYTQDRDRLHVEFFTKECNIPDDERARLERLFLPLDEAVYGLPPSELRFTITFHPKSQDYHAEARLRVAGQTLFTSDWDPYLDCALQRCVRKLVHKVEAYRENPDRPAEEVAQRLEAINQDVVAPEPPAAGGLEAAVRDGDYKKFRTSLANYEDWLRNRIGRWVQRYPYVDARVGDGIRLGDLVEEVYLNAFERFSQRPPDAPLHQWLDGLIDPSLRDFLRHPAEERENASLARTLRTTPM